MNSDNCPVAKPNEGTEPDPAASSARPRTAWDDAAARLHGLSKSYREQAKASRLPYAVGVDAAADRLDALADEIDKLGLVTDVELAKQDVQVRREDWLKRRQHQRDWITENTRQTVQLAMAAIRTVVLINGGALVALLAFLGNVWAKSGPVAAFAPSFRWFAAGLIIATVTLALAYAAQYCYGESDAEGDTLPRWLKAGKRFHVAAILFFIIALGAFGTGCFESFSALRTAEPPPIIAPTQEAQNGRAETADQATAGANTAANAGPVQQEGPHDSSAPAVATEGPAASIKRTGEEVAPMAPGEQESQ